jgi:hypothetical protein
MVYGESYLCIPDAGAMVEDGDNKPISSYIADVSRVKYILTDESGKWVFKAHSESTLVLDSCSSPYYCEKSVGYGGTFIRDDHNVFSLIWLTVLNDRNQLVAIKGHCSKV